MKTSALPVALLALLATAGSPRAAPGGPTPFPDWRNEAAWPGHGPIRVFGWMMDNRNWFWSQRAQDQGAVVFVGDSLTGNWKREQMQALFPGLKLANRGIGGDVSRGVLFRFREDVLDLRPRAVVLCIGANDLSAHADPAVTAGNIAAILAQARQADPRLPVVLCTVPPRASAEAPTLPGALGDLNARIRQLGAGQKQVVVLDLFAALATPGGEPVLENFAQDRLHLAPAGYIQWAARLRPVLQQLGLAVGEPGALPATAPPLPHPPAAAQRTGPRPFPDPQDETAWPGHGPIRVFGFMTDNRNWFWTRRTQDQGAVVFAGDSLTGNWKLEQMQSQFPGLKVANRGIGGDVSRGLLFRFREDVLDLRPRAVVLCIGANDLSAHAEPALVADNLAAILTQAQQADPQLPVVLCTVPPRASATAPTVPGALTDLNARIRQLGAGREHVALLDLFTLLATPEGQPVAENFAPDRLHLAPPGFARWATALRPVLEQLGVK